MTKRKTGVRRTVTFVGWCQHHGCNWHGPERSYKADATFDVSLHVVDKHGGSWLAESGRSQPNDG